jgi:polyhydroxyalkanoate synthesis repressor PhaR
VKSLTIIKKYSNRRLYDTGTSRYITRDELAKKIRGGSDVQVVDAKTGADLTGATLAQILIDDRQMAHVFPAAVLIQLIRMEDDELGEFCSRYMPAALTMFLHTQSNSQATGASVIHDSASEVTGDTASPWTRLATAAAGYAPGPVIGSPFPSATRPTRPPEPNPDREPVRTKSGSTDPVSTLKQLERAVLTMRSDIDELKNLIQNQGEKKRPKPKRGKKPTIP